VLSRREAEPIELRLNAAVLQWDAHFPMLAPLLLEAAVRGCKAAQQCHVKNKWGGVSSPKGTADRVQHLDGVTLTKGGRAAVGFKSLDGVSQFEEKVFSAR
jgi:hypothetical protein